MGRGWARRVLGAAPVVAPAIALLGDLERILGDGAASTGAQVSVAYPEHLDRYLARGAEVAQVQRYLVDACLAGASLVAEDGTVGDDDVEIFRVGDSGRRDPKLVQANVSVGGVVPGFLYLHIAKVERVVDVDLEALLLSFACELFAQHDGVGQARGDDEDVEHSKVLTTGSSGCIPDIYYTTNYLKSQ